MVDEIRENVFFVNFENVIVVGGSVEVVCVFVLLDELFVVLDVYLVVFSNVVYLMVVVVVCVFVMFFGMGWVDLRKVLVEKFDMINILEMVIVKDVV